MTLEEIRELIKLVTDTGVAELEVQRGDNRVRIRLAMPGESQIGPVYHSAPHSQSQPSAGGQAEAKPQKAESSEPPSPDPNVVLVKSPIVGTYYESSAPGVPAFVRVGEKVQPGKVLCVIESMKLMNEIEAEVAGVIESKLVPNGQPVEYGEALFAIRAL
jgi:acetyl-CoA carboxylase biotin carboxyl carrier protein